MSVNILTLNDNKNFGDGVNNRFWRELTKKNINYNAKEIHYITTGSIMNFVKPTSIILGTGFITDKSNLGGIRFKSKTNKKFCMPEKVISVRGPNSRKKLLKFGISCPKNYGDPLILMPCIYGKKNKIEENVVGIIPHYKDKNNSNFRLLIENLKNSGFEVKIIDIEVNDNYEKLIDEINMCKYIISSSLHGVIMGVVYQKKTIFVEFSTKVLGGTFKFQDFFGSIAINYKNINVYDKALLENVIPVNYQTLQNVGVKFISLIPFINQERKKELQKNYQDFYNF